VPVASLIGVKAISAGERHSCAVLLDGSVYCWGANADGQIGDGDPSSRSSPVRVPGVGQATDVAAGSVATCAVLEDGSALCWGNNAYGQLGDGSAAPQAGPIQVFALNGVRKIAAHWQHFCALRDDETLWCWGNNTHGQIGNGSTLAQPQPYRVGLNGVTSAGVGLQHTCAATRAEGLWCWGDGSGGQLGDGDRGNAGSSRPARVPSIGDPVAVSVGAQHSCVLRVGGGAWCWGNNLSGQLGDGTADGIAVPVPASGLDHLVEVVAGEKFTCARRDEGTIWCWGDNHAGQLGIGSPVLRVKPEPVAGITRTVSVAAGGAHTCAVTQGAAGQEILCWGANPAGQLGDNRNVDRARPAALKVPLLAAQVAAGASHTCARTAADQQVFCWGRGNSGQLGPASQVDTRLPVVALGTPAGALATGGAHTCALAAGDGRVLCWGAGTDGQLGDGSGTDHATPSPVAGLTGARDIAAGEGHTCALGGHDDDGAVSCWGRDDHGQLGDGRTVDQPSPIAVPLPDLGPAGAAAVAAGGEHSCALARDGRIFCWGRGDRGQLGSDSPAASAPPAVVAGVPAATTIAAGGAHTCAVTASATVWCWGGNQSGQLGDGVTLQVSTPQLDRIACP
jgi:alpha-tubulin suppressor-like RCC1 family protein